MLFEPGFVRPDYRECEKERSGQIYADVYPMILEIKFIFRAFILILSLEFQLPSSKLG